jgi:hypothetical protein
VSEEPSSPRSGRRRKRDRSWDYFLQTLLFAVVAVVLKEHFGWTLPPYHP